MVTLPPLISWLSLRIHWASAEVSQIKVKSLPFSAVSSKKLTVDFEVYKCSTSKPLNPGIFSCLILCKSLNTFLNEESAFSI